MRQTVMRLTPRDGGTEEIVRIGGIEREEPNGYHVLGLDGTKLGYFGSDRYENVAFEIWWLGPSPKIGTKYVLLLRKNINIEAWWPGWGDPFVSFL